MRGQQYEYGREKNWPNWKELSDALVAQGLKIVAVGAPDASDRRLENSVFCTMSATVPTAAKLYASRCSVRRF